MYKDEELLSEIAEDRIGRLFNLAEKRISKNKESDALSKRYVHLAREISSHYKIKMPQELKDKFCKKCNSLLLPGLTCTVRVSNRSLIYKCNCGEGRKIFLSDSKLV